MTTGVGSVGLTLTAATNVIVFDPDWNPGKDDQAVDRTYRIGQTKPVVVFRLITCDTIEERIYRRQIFKKVHGSKMYKGSIKLHCITVRRSIYL